MVKARRKVDPKKKKALPPPPKKEQSQQESEQESSSEQSSQQSSTPVEANVKTLQFRKRRGQKMNYLINKKKDDEDDDDDFWKNNAYFGDAENQDDQDEEEEDYVESSDGQDEFDSDFLSSKSQKEQQEKQQEEMVVQEQESITKRKRKPIQTVKPPIKRTKPTPQSNSQIALQVHKPIVLKYIHEQFTQQQLLAEAAHTQYFNYLSLQKLISLQQGKKVYHRKQVQVQPPKVVYKSKLEDGKAVSIYKMVGFDEDVTFLDLEDPI